MLKVKGGAGGGASKNKSRGVGKETVLREEALSTNAENVLRLRAALRTDDGQDRDVLADFVSFTRFQQRVAPAAAADAAAPAAAAASPSQPLAATIEFALPRRVGRDDMSRMVAMTRRAMEATYDDCGYGWDTSELRRALRDDAARILLVRRAAPAGSEAADGDVVDASDADAGRVGDLLGYLHFRFSIQGELTGDNDGEPAIIVYDLQLAPQAQRRGLGRHLMAIVELIARKWRIQHVMVPTVGDSAAAVAFLTRKLRGYGVDDFAPPDGQQTVYSKAIALPAGAVDPAFASAAAKTSASGVTLSAEGQAQAARDAAIVAAAMAKAAAAPADADADADAAAAAGAPAAEAAAAEAAGTAEVDVPSPQSDVGAPKRRSRRGGKGKKGKAATAASTTTTSTTTSTSSTTATADDPADAVPSASTTTTTATATDAAAAAGTEDLAAMAAAIAGTAAEPSKAKAKGKAGKAKAKGKGNYAAGFATALSSFGAATATPAPPAPSAGLGLGLGLGLGSGSDAPALPAPIGLGTTAAATTATATTATAEAAEATDAAGAGAGAGEEDEAGAVLEGLKTMFAERHGREARDDEVAMWMEQLREASEAGVSVA